MKKKTNIMDEALKIYKKKCREEEIALYGKPICHNHIEKNKKAYTRKNKHKGENNY